MTLRIEGHSWRYADGEAGNPRARPTHHLYGRGMWHPVDECVHARCGADSPANTAPIPVQMMGLNPAQPRVFSLVRHEDVSGVSGTGIVAQGVQFRDGQIALQWCCPGLPSSMSIWPSLEDMLTIHGHRGRTEVVWA